MSAPSTAQDRPVEASRRRRWWREVLLLGMLYGLYTGVRATFGDDVLAAFRHGRDLLHVEQWLHIAVEQPLNGWVSHVAPLALVACYSYATLHFIVTAGVLVWLYACRPTSYPTARTTLVLTTLLALVGFALVPTAPPRMLGGGWVDTMDAYSSWGWWGSSTATAAHGAWQATDQFAAMPSLHVGWALWAGWMIFRCARHRWVRALGLAYPVFITFVVLSTANHYLLDALAGAAVLGLAAVVASIFAYARPFDEEAVADLVVQPTEGVINSKRIGSHQTSWTDSMTRAVTVRLDEADHAALEKQADQLRVRPGTLARILVHAGLSAGVPTAGGQSASAALDRLVKRSQQQAPADAVGLVADARIARPIDVRP